MNLIEKQISSETIYDGKIIKICKDTALLPNGNTAIREIVKHNGGLCLLNNSDIHITKFY